jgi:hypothetical protein
MYSLSLLIVELETARTTLLGVFEVSNDTPEYRGVLYIEMGRKSDAEADLAALQKLSPRLAKELAEVIQTGKEEDRFYGLASKISG